MPMIEIKREVPCCMCSKMVQIESRTTEHPEAPEMLRPAVDNPDAWLGMLCTENGHEIATVCGDDCLVKLFAEAVDQAATQVSEVVDETKVDTEPAPPAE